ncbi:MAG: hypothetical protein AAFX99_13320, partial [Myxococcota bacterium]
LVMHRYLTRSMRGENRGVTVAALRYLMSDTPVRTPSALMTACPNRLGRRGQAPSAQAMPTDVSVIAPDSPRNSASLPRAQPLVMHRYLTRSMRGENRGVTVAALRYLIFNTPAQTAWAHNTPAPTAKAAVAVPNNPHGPSRPPPPTSLSYLRYAR